MIREIITTKDGSTSIFVPDLNETYHSRHGAIQEAYHVFIKNGLHSIENQYISILEIGFGTGLNAFTTYIEATKYNKTIKYLAVEAFPLLPQEALKMNYGATIEQAKYLTVFEKIHNISWNEDIRISKDFILNKQNIYFEEINYTNQFNLIYFDAFGYDVQPELWSKLIFDKMYKALKSDGILVTYACRNVIKNAMIEAGFSIEKLEGAPGKREMLRAIKV